MGRDKGGKLASNWEGPYRVQEAFGGGAYRLETLKGKTLPRTWNVANLRFYFSLVVSFCTNMVCLMFPVF
ncbi:gag-pol polyprotein [Trifolium medium]|uniref:Gag-pol polyprotein n=1 Tax=Trifolium medium TaxID=97028 RepID=A0A392MBM8_9FABA|nr:gag-pol polyprotein [Trifolium medium]